MGASVRLNSSERDDPEAQARAPQVQFTELRPFSGAGQALGAGQVRQDSAAGAPAGSAAAPGAAGAGDGSSRNKWLDRFEQDAAQKSKTVRELEEDKLQHMERERLNGR
mmetsp:Transcript_42878/g.97324  ORF Transcript_42878/g.97324 Transcript_42878/m.97324 type:complete len:109 (-) Transcript_42878:218-544(-)